MNEKWITPQGNRSNSDLGYVPLTPKRVDPAAEWRRRADFAEAQVQADEEAERSLRARYNDLLVDHARLAAQVLRVRELRDRFATHEKSISYQAAATLLTRALDGDA